MIEYKGNSIYDYVVDNDLDYYFSAEHNWILVYGNSMSIPKVLAFASKVNDINEPCMEEEMNTANKAYNMAKYLNLPFLFVRFMVNSSVIAVCESRIGKWVILSYDQLRDLYEEYGVVQPGTARKRVNQYVSSPYHDWQRQNLGRITVSDFDLLKYRNSQIQGIIELKRSKIKIEQWNPYPNDFPNFALLINTIVGSGKKIPFRVFYNVMEEGVAGSRREDISKIKVFDFNIPDNMIGCQQISYRNCGIHTIDKLLD